MAGYGSMSYGTGSFGHGGYGYGPGQPDLRLIAVREIAPHGVALRFSYSLADLPVTWTLGTYDVTAVAPGVADPVVVGVHSVFDATQVALEFADDLVFGETYQVEIVGALMSVDGAPMEVGHTTLQFTYWWWHSSARPRNPGTEKILQAYTDGFGRAMSELTGYHMTRLLEPFAFGDTEMVVDGTLHFSNTGTVICSGRHVAGKWISRKFDYTSREPSRLLGVTAHDATDRLIVNPANEDSPNTGEIEVGALVLDWSHDYSHTDRAAQSAFCQRAQSAMLDRAAGRHGFGRPYGMSDAVFQDLIASIVYQERSRWLDLYRVLRAALQDYWISMAGQFVLNREIVEGGGLNFEAWMTGHFIEDSDTGEVYQVRTVDVTTGRLHLSQFAAPWWSPFPSAGGAGRIQSFSLMPFIVQQIFPAATDPDQRIIIRITLHLPIDAWPPGTYLMDPTYVGDWETPANWAQPPRGFLEEKADDWGPGPDGLYQPLYISGMTVEAAPGPWVLRILDQVLPSGHRLETVALPAV